MQQHLIEHTAQHIAVTLLCGSCLHCLRNGTAQASCRPRMLCKDFSPDLGRLRGRWRHRSAIGTHNLTAEGLLFIRYLYHVNLTVQIKISTCHGKGCSPLSCSRLCGNTLQPLYFRIICLRNSRVQFMASTGVVSLKFVINLCRRLQLFFQTVCTNQRRGTVHFIETTDFLRNINVSIYVIQLLSDQLVTKNRAQLIKGHRFLCARIQQRRRFILHICTDIVPLSRHLVFFKIDFVWDFLFFTHRYILLIFLFLRAMNQADMLAWTHSDLTSLYYCAKVLSTDFIPAS